MLHWQACYRTALSSLTASRTIRGVFLIAVAVALNIGNVANAQLRSGSSERPLYYDKLPSSRVSAAPASTRVRATRVGRIDRS